MKFNNLFSPITIRGLELPNRIVMSAMGTHESAASEDGRMVTDKLIAFHTARAKGGCGLNTTECCAVDFASSPKGFLAISDDRYIPGMKALCDSVHAAGGRMAVQLWQGGLAVGSDPTSEIIIPSDLPFSPEFTLPGVSEERILTLIEAFGTAAARAVKSGFDAVEFHCGHNYSPHSFLSPAVNKRTDRWGGSFENRMRYPLECIRAIRKNIPDDMPLFMRIVWKDDFDEAGLTPEDMIEFCKRAGAEGVDVINVSRGNMTASGIMFETPPVDLPNGFNVDAAARIRKETGMLVMPCGRINKPGIAEEILEEGKADLVVMARAQLADPDFCNKAKEGRLSSIKYCIGCDQGCYDYFFNSLSDPSIEHITCMRNPALLEEEKYEITKTSEPKKVLVAGGGIAGIEAADILFRRGHRPILCEAGEKLGGQFFLAGAAPRKSDFQYAAEMAAQNVIDEGVEIRFSTPVTPALIEEAAPDAVIIAVGSQPVIPGISGADLPHVMEAHELLAGTPLKRCETADNTEGEAKHCKAVVIGGGLVGMEAAEYLSAKGCEVTVVEMKAEILTELGNMRKIGVGGALMQEKINVLLNTVCKEITEGKVLAASGDEVIEIEADTVVMAVGSRPVDSSALQSKCEELGIPYRVVGDALAAPRLALDAIHEGIKAAYEIV